jgi:hypothetical protein
MTTQQAIRSISWPQVRDRLYGSGFASLGTLLDRATSDEIAGWYDDEKFFRSRVEMARYRFGKGEYKYFAYPLPDIVAGLRESLYRPLAPIASEWMRDLGQPGDFPPDLQSFVQLCHSRGQKRPTPILLRYRAGDFNCLHQDLYGELFFPFQVIFALNQRGKDYAGGELVLVEQRPRAQSTANVIIPAKGEAIVITTRYRPVRGTRGFYRSNVRHGVRNGRHFVPIAARALSPYVRQSRACAVHRRHIRQRPPPAENQQAADRCCR